MDQRLWTGQHTMEKLTAALLVFSLRSVLPGLGLLLTAILFVDWRQFGFMDLQVCARAAHSCHI